MKTLRELKCPICGEIMSVRIKNQEHANAGMFVKKHKYYQYFCPTCDDGDSGWTSTQSDELSLKIK